MFDDMYLLSEESFICYFCYGSKENSSRSLSNYFMHTLFVSNSYKNLVKYLIELFARRY